MAGALGLGLPYIIEPFTTMCLSMCIQTYLFVVSDELKIL